MYIESIYLENFRNYETLKLNLSKGINIIYGKNGQGKTNLLESLYVLAITKSHRSSIDNYLIKVNQKYLKIEGKLKKNKFSTNLKLLLNIKKEIYIDNKKINKISDYISNMNVIIFYPEDLELIKGSPNVRRKFLNLEISQLNSSYYNVLLEYNKLLKMRNDYIKKISINDKYDTNYLNVLNNYLVDKGIIIYNMRKKFIKSLNENNEKIFKNISKIEGFNVKYISNIEFDVENKEQIKHKYLEKLEKNLKTDIKMKATMIGPHRDDIEFYIKNDNLKLYGSQGQQRMAILSLKLSEINIFKNYTGYTPILLLDDIFSELDTRKKNNLLRYIKNNIQTIITTTDLNSINKKIIDKSKLIEIKEGKLNKIKEVKINE